ncbi:MAG: Ig-like domain-containing protein [Bacteroidota bacterium]
MLKNLLLLLAAVTILSCANQTQPTGGPKDEDPPELLSSDPIQGSINVVTDKIELTFNEDIKTENAIEQLIITPRIDTEFEIKYRKSKATITFEENLPDSTTFTFNFREAVVDITEGNAPKNLKLAFSTGNYLDSLSISGNVKYHLTDRPGENITVALYQTSDTLDLFTGPPLYFTKTDNNGDYLFENLKGGNYKIYAFDDLNKNLTAQSNSESFGFLSGIIPLDSNIVELNLPLISVDARPLELQSARQSGTTFNVKYNKSLSNYNISADSHETIVHSFADNTQDNIRIYNTFHIEDSLQLFLSSQDSLNQFSKDTIYLKFEPTQRKPITASQTFDLQPIVIEQRLVTGQVGFNKPITKTNFDSTYIYIDSTHVYFLDSTNFKWGHSTNLLEFSYLLDQSLFEEKEESSNESQPNSPQDSLANDSTQQAKPELKPHIRFSEAAFISAESDSSTNIKTNLTFTTRDKFGLIALEIQTDYTNYIIQLLDAQNEVVAERINTQKFDFSYLKPGTYRIRILIDTNENGVWDPGNIFLDIEPEPSLFYDSSTGEQEVIIRANFEIVPDPIQF